LASGFFLFFRINFLFPKKSLFHNKTLDFWLKIEQNIKRALRYARVRFDVGVSIIAKINMFAHRTCASEIAFLRAYAA